MSGKKFAVITPTYYRQDNSSKRKLLQMFKSMQKQTCQDFKLYLIGDDYSDRTEFKEIVKQYPSECYHINLKTSLRSSFKNSRNNWSCGGMHATYKGIQQAIADGFEYYLHLDDDDVWLPNHVELINSTLISLPKADFVYTRAKFVRSKDILYLPKLVVSSVKYNNLIPEPSHIVHATWCINLKTIGPYMLDRYKQRLDIIQKFKTQQLKEYYLPAYDSVQLAYIKAHCIEGKWLAVYIPTITCNKLSMESNNKGFLIE